MQSFQPRLPPVSSIRASAAWSRLPSTSLREVVGDADTGAAIGCENQIVQSARRMKGGCCPALVPQSAEGVGASL
jgi:hypothetical protein